MSERMQFYVRYCDKDNTKIWARDFSWCYGTRAVSRVRYTIEYILHNFKYSSPIVERLLHILETNFDFVDYMPTINIVSEWRQYCKNTPFEDFIKSYQNNDGYVFIDVDVQKNYIHYAFAWEDDMNCPLNAEEYMTACFGDGWEQTIDEYECENTKTAFYENVKFLEEASKEYEKDVRVMSKDELSIFINSLGDDITADRVTVSLAELYSICNEGKLAYYPSSLYIRHTKDENGNEYFDLIDKNNNNKIILCDGEEVNVRNVNSRWATLETDDGDTFILSLYEYTNAVFSC